MSRMHPGALTAFVTAAYGALVVCVTGFVSLLTDSEVIAVPGVGAVPGALAVVVSTAAFGGATYAAVRVERPRYPSAAFVALVTAAAHLASLWALALLFGAGLGTATAGVAGAMTSWTSPAFLVVAAACAWVAVALRRTRARPPQWPWERHPPEE